MSTTIDTIYTIIKGHDVLLAEKFKTQIQPYLSSNKGNAIHALNEFWQLQLGTIPSHTSHIRACFNDGLTEDQWLSIFNKQVFDLVIRFNLPK